MPESRPFGPSPEALNARRLVDLLELRAETQPDEIVYNYLSDDGTIERRVTYGQLFDDAQRVATLVLNHVSPGDRAILLFGSGLDFVLAFMGCQVAGVVPVPVMPPRSAEPTELGRVMAIMDDVGSNLMVTSEQLIQMGQAFFQGSSLAWLSVEDLDGVEKTAPVAFEDAGELALLQYTSGSTSRPRGVMVGHDNLMQNLADIYWAEGASPETISVSWLPMSHDMGLIEGVLQPLYRGSPVYLMSPMTFLRKPLCWLDAISKYRATVSGGPNFAYDLVLRRLGDGPIPDWDLSCWQFAYNGSEPVSPETIENFADRLACRGLKRESMHALFGIAEATLGVSEGRHKQLTKYQQRVGAGGERTVVSCGVTAPTMDLRIVDPETFEELADGEEGEIWLNGPCITRGYWRQPEKTKEVFQAQIKGSDKHYLRTGDLGFIVDGEIYISGRIKEVIISRGLNVHPQDMELTGQKAHPYIRPGGIVAFAIPGQEEAAGIVAEIDKKVFAAGPTEEQLREAANAVRKAVTLAHGVPVGVMALVKPGTIPRTTSGKRQRLRVAKMWASGKLDTLVAITHGQESDASIEGYLKDRVANLLGVEPETIDESKTLTELGLDSLRTLELLVDVHDRFPAITLAEMLTQSLSDLASPKETHSSQPWLEDAKLPQDIHCPPNKNQEPRTKNQEPIPNQEPRTKNQERALVTGATGFLGSHVVTRLLATSDINILALVRGDNAQDRLLETLSHHPDWNPDWATRIEAVPGELSQPESYADLEVDAIYHIAAMVNWVYPYHALSDANVRGTQELLRLACKNATPFVYVSTSAVCWSHGATDTFDEDTDPMTHIDGIHLNYVRTKAVAESLVRQAATRGLPATIVRPGLIFSHSKTGYHSPGDFLSALFKGCIEMGAAPDLDWSLEVCPVDDVARIVTDHVRTEPGVTTLHAEPPKKRLWRGAVLWMALRGYDVELVDYDTWCQRLEAHAAEPTAALRPLLPFFTRPADGELRLPQLYEETRRNPMCSQKSKATLNGQSPSAMDARLLQKTFDNLVHFGYLPAARREGMGPGETGQNELSELKQDRIAGEHGIIGELASWRYGKAAGLTRRELQGRTVVAKSQVPDEQTLDVGQEVAYLCSEALGDAWKANRDRNEANGSHLREAAIYALEDDAIVRHRPAVHGIETGALVIEDLTGLPMLNSAHTVWSDEQIGSALSGIANIHANWFGKPPTEPWLPPPRECEAQFDLWSALADVALEGVFGDALGESGRHRHAFLRQEVARWSKVESDQPTTLIHNDFNPRNVALRNDGRLVAYDWELARVGLPQRDLAEFLCFALDPSVSEETVSNWVDIHRQTLEEATGQTIDQDAWNLGFGAGLADFMVTRLPMYAMINRFHPQPFLERVTKTAVAIDSVMGFGGAN